MGTDDLGRFLQAVALPPGWRVLFEPSVTSTMDLARAAARRGLEGRWAFVADYQSEGRGRQGRTWLAPPGTALLVSLLLPFEGGPPLHVTQVVSVSLCQTLEALLGLEPRIKWPNDVLVDGRKVAGILAEVFSEGARRYAIVGCGVNANFGPRELAELPPTAGSLLQAAGRPVHRGELLVLLLERLGDWLGMPLGARAPAVRAEWEARLWRLGQRVRAEDGGEELDGVVEGLDEDGALLLRLEDGTPRRIVTGELIL